MNLDSFKKRINQLIDELKSSPLMEGSPGIFMPGEMEHAAEQACLKNGVLIGKEVLRTLDEFVARINLPRLSLGK